MTLLLLLVLLALLALLAALVCISTQLKEAIQEIKKCQPIVQWMAQMDPMLKDLLRGYAPPNFMADKLFLVPEHVNCRCISDKVKTRIQEVMRTKQVGRTTARKIVKIISKKRWSKKEERYAGKYGFTKAKPKEESDME